MAEAARRQKCPNCGRETDVSVYVSGQRVRCTSCSLPFEVVRADVRASVPPSSRLSRGSDPTALRPSIEPAAATLPGPAAPPAGARDPTRNDRPTAPVTLAATVVSKNPEIPGYELLELLGRGGMGEVWKARQASLGRTVAIKVLSPELAQDAEFVQRFEKEATALATLSHPNIVQIIERGGDVATRTFFFAMEFCEGRSLRELMEAKALDLPTRLRLVAQIGHAIEYAHGRGVIHRDLKPENILVDPAGNPKVVDFGLAGMRRGDSALNLTRAATAMGTLHYMAPEQRRDARSVDERADVYSLGVMLYELLTGDVPQGRFKLPSEKVPGVDTRLDKIVSKALETEPEARYPGAHELTVELEAVLGASASQPRTEVVPAVRATLPATVPEGALAPTSRHRVARFMVVGALLAVGGLVVGTQLNRRPRRPRPEPAPVVAMPQDTNAPVPVTLQKGRGVDYLELEVLFAPGGGALQAGTGEWRTENGELVARVFGPGTSGRPKPLAILEAAPLLAAGLAVEASFDVATEAPTGYVPVEAPQVEVMLKGEGDGRVGLKARYGPGAGYTLTVRPPEGETFEESRSLAAGDDLPSAPVVGKLLRVKILALNPREIEVFAGPEEPLPRIFRSRVDLKDLQGKVALACLEATCRFKHLEVVGRPAQVARPPEAGNASPAAPEP